MLSYAFQVLKEQGYKNLETEEFHNMADLCAAILNRGLSLQIKKGLGKEYIPENQILSTVRGKIDLSASIKSNLLFRRKLSCSFEEFTENSPMNQIIKTTLLVLLKADIPSSRKREIRKLLVFLSEVDYVDTHSINWRIQFNRTNQTYQMLIAICNLVIKGLLQTNIEGNTKLMDFLDEQRTFRLFEKFILEYYKKELPQYNARSPQISWQVDDDFDEMLPIMQTDTILNHGNKILIIDAKYYSKSTQFYLGSHKLHAANLYQIFAYVKNKEIELKKTEYKVSGMLLYAKTDEEIQPDNTYQMSGSQISVTNLNLDCDFSYIAEQLNSIANNYFSL